MIDILHRCRLHNLRSFSPLWQRNQHDLLREMVGYESENGARPVDAVIVKVQIGKEHSNISWLKRSTILDLDLCPWLATKLAWPLNLHSRSTVGTPGITIWYECVWRRRRVWIVYARLPFSLPNLPPSLATWIIPSHSTRSRGIIFAVFAYESNCRGAINSALVGG